LSYIKEPVFQQNKELKMKVRCLLIGMTVLFVFGLLTTSSYAKIDQKTIVGMWLFDDGSGTIATDSSGNKINGTLMNGPKWVDGKFGKALEFDGVDDYVSVPGSFSLQPTKVCTISTWIYPRNAASPSTDMAIISLGTAAPRYYMTKSSINFQCRIQTKTGVNLTFYTGSAEFDKWQHVAYTYDGANIRLYVNGALVGTKEASGDILTDDKDFRIADWPGGARNFNGLIDEVAVFNVTLTEDDIKNIMNNGLGKSIVMAAVFPKGKLTSTWAGIKARD
jgi:hypothetical protein